MKKEFIMSDEERTVKRRKIEENRLKKIKTNPQVNKLSSTSHQLVQLLNGGPSKKEIKPEPESSFSDSDVSASPLDNSSEGYHDNLLGGKHLLFASSSHDLRGCSQKTGLAQQSSFDECVFLLFRQGKWHLP